MRERTVTLPEEENNMRDKQKLAKEKIREETQMQ